MDLLKKLNDMEINEFLKHKGCWYSITDGVTVYHNVKPEDIIEFTKYHVQEALKEASEKASVEYIDLTSGEIFDYTDVITDDNVGADVNKDSILNAYPLKNIK